MASPEPRRAVLLAAKPLPSPGSSRALPSFLRRAPRLSVPSCAAGGAHPLHACPGIPAPHRLAGQPRSSVLQLPTTTIAAVTLTPASRAIWASLCFLHCPGLGVHRTVAQAGGEAQVPAEEIVNGGCPAGTSCRESRRARFPCTSRDPKTITLSRAR